MESKKKHKCLSITGCDLQKKKSDAIVDDYCLLYVIYYSILLACVMI